MTDRDLSSFGRCRRRRSHGRRSSRDSRRRGHRIECKLAQRVWTAFCWRGNDVVDVITVSVQATAIDGDLNERTCPCGMANRDFSCWNCGSRDTDRRRRGSPANGDWLSTSSRPGHGKSGRRRPGGSRTATRGRRNDVTSMIAVAIESIAINCDLDISPTTSGVADSDASWIEHRCSG